MKYAGFMLLAVLLSACGGSDEPSSRTSSRATVGGDWSALDQTLDSYLESSGGPLSGYAFALFDANGLVHTRAGGEYTMDTVIRIASASKVPSAAAILTLVDSGQLDLDEPVATYIEQAGNPINWPVDKRNITMRMLLNHTSGILGLGDTQPNCLDRLLGFDFQECAQIVALTPLTYPPGTAFSYGGASYQVAGYVATLIAGTDWQTFFDQAIGEPLGLRSYGYGDPAVVANPRVAGGGFSDVGDYARILRMLQNDGVLDGRRVLSAESVAFMHENQTADLPILFAPFSQQVRRNYDGYSFGFWHSDPGQHPGSAGPELSDPGLYGTVPWIDEGVGYGAVILIDQNTRVGLQMWDAVRPLIIPRFQ